MDNPNTLEQIDNAGLLGPLMKKEAGADTITLPPELKAASESINGALKELRDQNDMMQKGKVDESSFKDFSTKVNADIDKLEKSITDGMKTIRAANEQEIKTDDRDLAVEYLSIKGMKGFMAKDITPDHIEEAKAYSDAFETYLRKDASGLSSDEHKALSNAQDPNGGYWVPTAMSNRIITKVHETTPMRGLATVEVVSGDSWEVPNDRGFVEARWADSTSESEKSETPKTGMRKIMVHNLQAMPTAPQNLLEDANRNVEQWIANKVATGFTLKEATAFVRGDGNGMPRGFMTYSPVEYDKANDATDADWKKLRFIKSGNANGFGSLDGFINLLGSLKTQYRGNARFMAERMATTKLRLLKDNDGRYLLDYSNTQRGIAQVFGYAITEGDDMDELAAGKFPIAFGDFRSAYTIVQRRGIRVLRDPFSAKPLVQFDHTARVGGDMVDFDALRVMKIAA